MKLRHLLLLMVAASCGVSISCAGPGDEITLQGAGATFPAPLYKRWFLEYYKLHPDVRVDYQAIGSGAGIRQFIEGLVDFGASDAAMTDKEISKIPGGVQLLPMTAGSIAICYNLPSSPSELKISRKALAGIALGEITSWSDPALTSPNPGIHLPDLPITFVRRSDGSGTTFAFTKHLSAISAKWRHDKGAHKSINEWPAGIGGKGNDGVAALIQQSPGAVGYIEYGYAQLTGMPMAQVENKSGHFVKPTMASSQAALAGAQFDQYLRGWVSDPAPENAYPIVTFTWLLCYPHYQDPKVAKTLKEVIRYGLTDGQKYSADLGYVPLPKNVVDKAMKALDHITP